MKFFRNMLIGAVALVTMNVVAGEMTDPAAFVKERSQAVLSALDGKREQVSEDAGIAQQIVREELLPYIDVEYISRLVLGTHWRSASEEQRARFKEAFQVSSS